MVVAGRIDEVPKCLFLTPPIQRWLSSRIGFGHRDQLRHNSRYPLAVDPLYGRRDAFLLSEIKAGYKAKRGKPERPLIGRLTLHAEGLVFVHPCTGVRVEVEAPLPKDFSNALRQLRKVRSPR